MKVDCDATPHVKFYFDARIEPQFVLLLNGAEIKRQVGFNFNLVLDHMEAVTELHLNKANYWGDSGEHWERFYDQFDRFAASGMTDRDAMIMAVED